ncbi:MAG: MraY family glycosyltransferase, partial [Coriobacteriia bacterium]
MSIQHYLFVIAVAAVVTALLTPLVRVWSIRRGLVDEPDARKVHEYAIPRLGGIAMFIGFAVAIGVEAYGELNFGWGGTLHDPVPQIWGVLIGLIIIFAVGVVDDIYTLSPGVKFVGQIVAAGVVIAAGLRIDYIGNPFGNGLLVLGLLGIPLTLVYIVGFANVINLIDGLDGLAAGVTAIAAVTFLVLAAQTNRLEAAALAAALIGACLGFLRY